MEDKRMPVLFLGHGSPMNAIEENQFVQGFRDIEKEIPRPKAILCISAHWFIKGTKVTAMALPKTIHDFYGFPHELYHIQYPAKGNPELANKVKDLLSPYEVELDYDWGIDHGAWSVIKHLYPNADIPLIQLSIDISKDAQSHFEMAAKLSSLRDDGVLIIGSGNIVHNLSMVDYDNFSKDNYGFEWAIEVRGRVNSCLINNDFTPLIEYKKESKAFSMAIPTPEHYLPLIYIIALKQEGENIRLFNDKMVAGSLSMTSLIISSR